jgi:hypothetical protein
LLRKRRYRASTITNAIFINSDGCKLNGPNLIHGCAPLMTGTLPNPLRGTPGITV